MASSSIYVPYIDGKLGLSEFRRSILGGVTWEVINPNFDHCYSVHGFGYPLSATAVIYSSVMEGKGPVFPKRLELCQQQNQFLVVTHEGLIFIVDHWDVDGDEKVSFYQPPIQSSGVGIYGMESSSADVIIGAMTKTKDLDKITKLFEKRKSNACARMVWTSVDSIVEKLNRDYPKESPDVTTSEKSV